MTTLTVEQIQADILAIIKAPSAHHTYYVAMEVVAREDWNTKRVEVRGLLGIAPNATTVIEYPIHLWANGYWNKTTTRRVVAQVKARLLDEAAKVGYGKRDLTEPMRVEVRL